MLQGKASFAWAALTGSSGLFKKKLQSWEVSWRGYEGNWEEDRNSSLTFRGLAVKCLHGFLVGRAWPWLFPDLPRTTLQSFTEKGLLARKTWHSKCGNCLLIISMLYFKKADRGKWCFNINLRSVIPHWHICTE